MRAFDEEDTEYTRDVGEEQYDREEDSMPISHIVLKREIERPIHVKVEAAIGAESTYLKFYAVRTPERVSYCFIDTLEPDAVLDTLEEKFEEGLLHEVEDFFKGRGRNISNPDLFHMKLSAVVGNEAPRRDL
jgi:hypothetical protein